MYTELQIMRNQFVSRCQFLIGIMALLAVMMIREIFHPGVTFPIAITLMTIALVTIFVSFGCSIRAAK